MANGIVLYCRKFARASFWDVCKTLRCSKNCLFSEAVKHLGREDLFSPVCKRYCSIEMLEKDLEKLTMPRTRQPVILSENQKRKTLMESLMSEKGEELNDDVSSSELTSYTDFLKDAVEDAFKEVVTR